VISKSSLSGRFATTAARYTYASLVVLLALLVARGLWRVDSAYSPLLVLLPAMVFSALYCGIGPSILATLVAVAGARYWLFAPVHSLGMRPVSNLAVVLTFVLAVVAIVALGEVRRRSDEVLRKAQRKLDEQVKERTEELHLANQNLRQLTARLLQLQDDERRRFARELHDSVGQMLAALSMNLSAVQGDIDRMLKTANVLKDSEVLVQEMSKEIRTISHLLHPPLLDEAGLVSALRWYTEGFSQRSNIVVDLDIPEKFGRLPRELETAVFRIIQECLTNVHRHSGSSNARIRVARFNGSLRVEVSDSGKGIPKDKQEELATTGTPGVGIRGMRERLRQLGGDLEIRSNGHGTLVQVELPIRTVSSAAA
jgi:signal transduction histidine kinase